MRDVIATFAAYSGQDMVVGPGAGAIVVQGASFTNKPWSQAFHALLATYGLSVAQMPGGILRIDSPGELAKLDSVEVLEHRVIRLNYPMASDMSVTVQNLVTPNGGAAPPGSPLNPLLITETPIKPY